MKSKKPGIKKEGHYRSRSVCKSKRGGNVNELQTQPIDAPSNEDSIAEDYTQVYFTGAVHYLKTVMAKTLNHSHSQPHIRPLWVSKELDLITYFRSPVESIQIQAATFYLCTKQNLFLKRTSSWDNRQ